MVNLFDNIASSEPDVSNKITSIRNGLTSALDPYRREMMIAARQALIVLYGRESDSINALREWKKGKDNEHNDMFSSHLYSQSSLSALNIEHIPLELDESSESIPGYQILNQCFDYHLSQMPELLAFGEDVGPPIYEGMISGYYFGKAG